MTLLTPLTIKGQTNEVKTYTVTNAVTNIPQTSCKDIGNPLSKAEITQRVDPRRISQPNELEGLFKTFARKSVGFNETNQLG